ncbi:MAG: hypothetical protein KDD11_04420 [Acidobacteria bacterium]|nr:hypothetical protein [Acidobacteriota bacterium]
MDRFSLLALGAARKALEQSGLDETTKTTCGIIAGNMFAGWTFTEPQLRALHGPGLHEVSPYLATAWFPAAPQGQITIQLRLRGFAKTVTTDRCAGGLSIGMAFDRIRHGKSELLLAGGVEAPLTPLVERSLPHTGKPSPSLCEAAAFVLLAPARPGGLLVRAHEHLLLRRRSDDAERIARHLEALRHKAGPGAAPVRSIFLNLPPGYDLRRQIEEVLDAGWPEAICRRLDLTAAIGETFAASGALAVVAACEALEEDPDAAALIISIGHQTCDLLWIDRSR